MALLGDDGCGYELARKLESQGLWRTWLGDSLYSNFIHFLSTPSSWEAFMRADFDGSGSNSDSFKTRAQLQLQLRVRALLFDKAIVSLALRSVSQLPSTTNAISKLNPSYLQLHGDDVYFTLEEAVQQREGVGASTNAASSKDVSQVQSKSSFGVGSRYNESELPETWYTQFFDRYRASKSYRLSFGDQETEKRTPEQMSTYLRVVEKHKRKRVAFVDNQNTGVGNATLHSSSNMLSNSVVGDSITVDGEAPFFPETMFTMNCVPDSAVLRKDRRVQHTQKLEFNGVLDTLPQPVTKSPIMIERLGIRPEYLNMDQGGNQNRGRNGSDGSKKLLSLEQASQLSHKVIARSLFTIGFEGSSELPLEVFAQLLSSHICKLGRTLKLLSDSYKRQCSAVELLKMFLSTTGHNNLRALSELVKDGTKNAVHQAQQQVQGIQSHVQQTPQQVQGIQAHLQQTLQQVQGIQSHIQGPIRQQPQQIPRHMHSQIQQILSSRNMAYQQQQQWEQMKRRQQATPRPGVNPDNKDRPMVEVKVENPSDFPMDHNTFNNMNPRYPQLQQYRQQQLAAMAQSSNAFRSMPSLQISQIQSPNMGMVRAPPVKVEGFQELMGGDTTLKHDSEENKLMSPPK